MNRNLLKIIAVVSMLVDHIGAYLFPDILIFRIIGRIAFPIFAYFIAEGWKRTRSKKKYFFMLVIFAVISQIPYFLLRRNLELNILFTFILSIALIYFIEKYKNNSILSMLGLAGIFLISVIGHIFGIIDYGIIGILIPAIIYFVSNKNLSFLFFGILLCLIPLEIYLLDSITFQNSIQFFSLISLFLLYLYNGEKGKINLKYFFYIFYPLHLLVIYIIKILI